MSKRGVLVLLIFGVLILSSINLISAQVPEIGEGSCVGTTICEYLGKNTAGKCYQLTAPSYGSSVFPWNPAYCGGGYAIYNGKPMLVSEIEKLEAKKTSGSTGVTDSGIEDKEGRAGSITPEEVAEKFAKSKSAISAGVQRVRKMLGLNEDGESGVGGEEKGGVELSEGEEDYTPREDFDVEKCKERCITDSCREDCDKKDEENKEKKKEEEQIASKCTGRVMRVVSTGKVRCKESALANADRTFRPLFDRTDGEGISPNGYPDNDFLAKHTEDTGENFELIFQGGEFYLISDDGSQALFEGVGVHQGEEFTFPPINPDGLSVKEISAKPKQEEIEKLSEEENCLAGHYSTSDFIDKCIDPETGEYLGEPRKGTDFTAEVTSDDGSITDADVKLVEDPKTGKEKLEVTMKVDKNAEKREHEATVKIKQDGKVVAEIPFVADVYNPIKWVRIILYLIGISAFGFMAVASGRLLLAKMKKKKSLKMTPEADYPPMEHPSVPQPAEQSAQSAQDQPQA